LEQAPSVHNNANDKRNGADFMGGLSKASTLLHGRLDATSAHVVVSSRLWACGWNIKKGEGDGALVLAIFDG